MISDSERAGERSIAACSAGAQAEIESASGSFAKNIEAYSGGLSALKLYPSLSDMINKGIQPNAVTLRNPDFGAIARAYACAYAKPQKLAEIPAAVAAALAADRPTIIEMTPRMLPR